MKRLHYGGSESISEKGEDVDSESAASGTEEGGAREESGSGGMRGEEKTELIVGSSFVAESCT